MWLISARNLADWSGKETMFTMSDTVLMLAPGRHCAGSPLFPAVTSSFAVNAKKFGDDSWRRNCRTLCTVNILLATGGSFLKGRLIGKKVLDGLSKKGELSAYRVVVTGTEKRYSPI